MKRIFTFILCLTAGLTLMAKSQDVIKTKVSKRPAGQKDAIELTVPAMDVVRIGVVGLGMRGPGAVYRFCNIEGAEVRALCDIEKDRVEAAQTILANAGKPAAAAFSGEAESYKALCERDDIDLVYICTDWLSHVQIALYAMEHGKNVAIEVPAATTLDDIWALINTSERTRKHCIMLENCVYDFFEMAVLNMAQQGLLGEIIHAEGSYHHNLEDFWPEYWNNWRLSFNRAHRGDVYPTHGIGPDCQLLNIHRGDRMEYLVAVDTKPINGPRMVEKYNGEECDDFQNGDLTSTLIRTVNGKSLLIQHDVMTPRPYSRMYQAVGTDGYASKYPVQQILIRQETADGKNLDFENFNAHEPVSDEILAQLLDQYTPAFVKEIQEKAKAVGGHGGMDFIMDYRLIYCLRNGLPLDMDVYDMAEWCCLGELTRISLEHNSAPVAIPDFTRGAWNRIQGFRYAF